MRGCQSNFPGYPGTGTFILSLFIAKGKTIESFLNIRIVYWLFKMLDPDTLSQGAPPLPLALKAPPLSPFRKKEAGGWSPNPPTQIWVTCRITQPNPQRFAWNF